MLVGFLGQASNVKGIAIFISEDNKLDYHCQSVDLVGGLCYIEPIYCYWITGYDYTRRDQLLRLVNFYMVAEGNGHGPYKL